MAPRQLLQRGLRASRAGEGRPRHHAAERRRLGVGLGLAQQPADHLLVELERVRQAWRPDVVRVRHQVHQACADEGRGGREVATPGQLLGRVGAEQVQRQVNAGPPARHVVLEVGEDPLVAEVDVGRQGHQHQRPLEGIEAVARAQRGQRRVVLGQREQCLACAAQPGLRAVRQEPLEVSRRDVEAAQEVGVGAVPGDERRARDHLLQQPLERREGGGQRVRRVRTGAGHGLPLACHQAACRAPLPALQSPCPA